jgi:hypothetical protein
MPSPVCLKGSRPCMGSVLEITLADSEPRRDCDALEAAFAEASRIECLLSAFRPESELSRLNRDAPRGPEKADPELLWLNGEARRYSCASDGAVDVTVAPLMPVALRDDRNGGMPLAPPSPRDPLAVGLRRVGACDGRFRYGHGGVRRARRRTRIRRDGEGIRRRRGRAGPQGPRHLVRAGHLRQHHLRHRPPAGPTCLAHRDPAPPRRRTRARRGSAR